MEQKMNKGLRLACLTMLVCLAYVQTDLIAQTRAQAEAALQRMTPEEIDQKLRELGITRAEAVRRAAELNINLEEYLSQVQLSQSTAQDTTALLAPAAAPAVTAAGPAEKKPAIIPGFSGRQGADSLRPFGYNIFQYPASTFEPVLNVATPVSYVLGPGDEVILSVWGDTKLYYQLQVNREGNLLIPDVGPIAASGMTVQQLRDKMIHRMTSVFSSLRNGERGATSFLDVSLGKLRTIQVFVLGEVQKPGGYSLSSLSTALQALYISGGPTIIGSLRNIEVVRNGKTVNTMDFYDYALKADKSKDIHLQDGDIVFVRPVGKRAGVAGYVLRPAIYELNESETLGDLLKLAGGLRLDSYIDRIHVERLIPFDERKNYANNYLDFDVHFSTKEEMETSKFEIRNGDVVTFFQVGLLPENRVTITGNVKKAGTFELTPGMRIKDLIEEADSLARNTFSERGTLFRLLPNLRRQVLSFNPRLALAGDTENNIELKNEDSLVIYQESEFFPERTVSVGGAVRNPGTYLRHDNMTVADLVVMAGGLRQDASRQDWELARIDTTKIGSLSKIVKFSVGEEYWEGNGSKQFLLQDFDHLMVPSNPKFNRQRVVVVNGYVLYPGAYALRNEGERLASIITRAGGIRTGAYLEGATLIRKWNRAGLVPIDFIKALADTESLENVELIDGDSINVPFKQEVVLVRGEVFVPSAVVHKKGAGLSYYLEQAGGTTDSADDERIVVTLPNGRKWQKGWFILPDPDILGGSTIFVPKKIIKEDKTLPVLRDWATIMASIAAITIGIIQITK
jgi:protein involved in polysaccharide export with SLBB domain